MEFQKVIFFNETMFKRLSLERFCDEAKSFNFHADMCDTFCKSSDQYLLFYII